MASCISTKRRGIDNVVTTTTTPSGPARASVRLRNRGSEFSSLARRVDNTKEYTPDVKLPSPVSLSFGVLGAVPFDCVAVGDVYWITYSHQLPWPAVVTQPPEMDKAKKKVAIKCAFFSDPRNKDSNAKTTQETQVELAKNKGIHSFRDDPIRLESFLANKVRHHRKYPTYKRVLDTAISEARHYLLRRSDMVIGDSPTVVLQSVCRRRLVEDSTAAAPASESMETHSHQDNHEEEKDFFEDERNKALYKSQAPAEIREELPAMKEALEKDAKYSFDKIMSFLKREATKAYLTNVIFGKEESIRHDRFLQSSPGVHCRMNILMHFGPWLHLEDEQKTKVLQCLRAVPDGLKKRCNRSLTATEEYLFAVLLPEAVIKMMMSAEKLSKELASTEYCSRFFS